MREQIPIQVNTFGKFLKKQCSSSSSSSGIKAVCYHHQGNNVLDNVFVAVSVHCLHKNQ